MKKIFTPEFRLQRLVATAALMFAFAGGCAESRSSLQEKISGLEREVTRLQSEKANLASRNSVLDDRILVIEKQGTVCREESPSQSPSLQVVKLGPGSQSARMGEAEDRIEFAPEAAAPADDSKRPVLTLMGASTRSSSYARAPLPSRGPVPVTGEGDNLGVVDASGNLNTSGTTTSGPMADFHNAYRQYSNKSFANALDGFSRFLKDNPDHGYADNAMFWRGECLLAQGKLLRAVGEYERLLRRYPRSEKGPSALYRIGFAYDKMHDSAKASEYYFKVVERHPGTDAARRASRRMAAIREGGSQSPGLIPTSARR